MPLGCQGFGPGSGPGYPLATEEVENCRLAVMAWYHHGASMSLSKELKGYGKYILGSGASPVYLVFIKRVPGSLCVGNCTWVLVRWEVLWLHLGPCALGSTLKCTHF